MLAAFLLFRSFVAVQFRVYDVTTDYVIGVRPAFLLLVLIQIWPIPADHRRILMFLWLARTGVILWIMLAYAIEVLVLPSRPGRDNSGRA